MPGKVTTTVNKYNVTRIPVVLFSDLRKLLTACLCAVSGRICYRFFKDCLTDRERKNGSPLYNADLTEDCSKMFHVQSTVSLGTRTLCPS